MNKTMTPRTTVAPGIAKILKRLHYPLEVILLCVRWYVACSLSLRDLEEMMAERDICIDHSTVHRWVKNFTACRPAILLSDFVSCPSHITLACAVFLTAKKPVLSSIGLIRRLPTGAGACTFLRPMAGIE
jgi:hypothetical protein